MKGSSPRTIAGVEFLVLTSLLALFVFRSFIPAWKTLNTDFRNYYVAARLYREGSSLLRVYDFTWFQRQKDHQRLEACVVGFVPDTLLSAVPIVPFAGYPPLKAKQCWLIVNLLLLAGAGVALQRLTQFTWRRVLILIFLAIEPLAKSFLYGQMHLAVFFLLALAVLCYDRKRPALTGIFIALAAALKLYPVLFVAYFLRKKDWKALFATLLACAGLAAISIFLFGWDVHRIYLREILPAIGRGENIDPYSPDWNSLTALLHRAFIFEPELNPHPILNAPSLYSLVQPFCQAVIFLSAIWLIAPGKVSRPRMRLEWAAFLCMLIALSTGPTSYHLCVLILAAALAIASLLELGMKRQAYLFATIYAVVCFPLAKLASHNADGWHMLLASPRVWPMLLLFFIVCAYLYQSDSTQKRTGRTRRDLGFFAAGIILLWAAGAAQSVIHFDGAFASYSDRVLSYPQSVLKGEPSVSEDGIYFERMPGQIPGFQVSRWNGELTSPLIPARDQFHPATALALHEFWLEDGGQTSNILRISTAASGKGTSTTLEVENGEQPSVSPDGKMLLFIRETRGRGALWMKRLTEAAHGENAREKLIVSDSYDVWEAVVAPGDQRVVFTAARRGQPELYSLDLTTSEMSRLSIPAPAQYPAVSPDGKWIAYSRFEGDVWQLYVVSLDFAKVQRVTAADCNSISPAWNADSRELIYATDCGRGLEMTTLVRRRVVGANGTIIPPR